jgi:hypothetical protein
MSIRPILLQLSAIICLLACISGCYNWTATENPISGIKVTSPNFPEIIADIEIVFSGSIVANNAKTLTYGIEYKPVFYERYKGAGFDAFSDTALVNISGMITSFQNSLRLPPNTRPGRYLFYSYVRDGAGRTSDSNKVYKKVIAPTSFPTVTPIAGATLSDNAITFKAGSQITLISNIKDSTKMDTLFVRLCRVLDFNQLSCVPLFTKVSIDRKFTDTSVIDLPVRGVGSQRYRIQIEAKNSLGNSHIWQPLFQIQ